MSRRVLFVDDEANLVWSTLRLLEAERQDLVFEGFTDPVAALQRVQEAPPDALVTDVRMPGLSGLQLLVRARAVVPGLPVVVVTAFGSPEVRDEVRKRGSVEYIEKPFALEALLAAVDKALSRATGFSGAVTLVALPDIVQMHALSRFTGALRFSNDDERATLFFVMGEIHDAECGDLRGSEAVYRVLTWRGGGFEAQQGAMPPERTIDLGWQELLIEGCRRLDESESELPDGWAKGGRASGLLREETVMANVKDSLERLAEVDGYIGACVVDSNSGMMLGSHGGGGTINLEVAAAGNTEVVRAKRKTMQNLGLKDAIEDILITLGKQYHLIRPAAAKDGLFIYLVLDKGKANLAMGRHKLADVETGLAV